MKTPILLKRLAPGLCLLTCLLALQLQAASSYWDINGATAGSGGPAPGGNWEDPNWTTDSTGSSPTTIWTDGDFPIFAAGTDATGSYSVTNNSDHTIAGMMMQTSAGTLTITGPGVLNITDVGGTDLATGLASGPIQGFSATGTGLQINAVLAGPGGFINTGGSVFLYGTNTYSGGTLLGKANKFIYFNNNNSFGTGPINVIGTQSILSMGGALITLTNDFTLNTTGILNFGSSASTPVTCSGSFTLSQTPQLKNNGNSTAPLTISGPISNPDGVTAGLVLQAPSGGTIVLSGTNTYSGQTQIGKSGGGNGNNVVVSSLNSVNGGTPLLASSSLGAPATAANGTIDLADSIYGATLIYTGPGETSDRVINLAGTSGSGTNQADGTGPLVLTGGVTATGIGSKPITLQGTNTDANTVSGAIVDNTTTGSTTLAAAFTSGKSTITLASVDGLTNGAPISGTGIPAGDTVKSINTGTKVVTLNANTTGSGSIGQTITAAGLVNLTGVAKAGTGTWVLSGANTYSGPTTVAAGTLRQGAANAIPYGPGKGNFASSPGAIFDINGMDCQLNGFGTSGGTIDNLSGTGTYTLTLGNNNAGGTHNGFIQNTSGTIQVVKVGAGGVTLNGSNSFTGSTTIHLGTLAITNDCGLGTPPATFVANQLILDTPNTNSLSTGYSLRIQNNSFTLAPTRGVYVTENGGAMNVQNGRTLTVAGVISGPGAFWSCPDDGAGYGVINLANNNTYYGPTYIGAGTLQLGVNGAIPAGSPLTIGWSKQGVNNNTTFDLNGFSQTIGSLASHPGFGTNNHVSIPLINLTGALTIIQTNDTTYNGTSKGSGGSLTLDATSTGKLTLAQTNLYTGPTTINGGTLELAFDNCLASTLVTVGNGAALLLDSPTALSAGANLILQPGANVNLNFTGTSTIHYLSFDGGATYVAPGTWGPIGSSATFTDARLTSTTGSGILSVLGAPSIALNSSLNPSTFGDSVTFDVTVTGSGATPTGTVTFQDGTTSLGTATLDGTGKGSLAVSSLTAGTHSITAAYSGDTLYGSGASAVLSQVVNPAASSTLLVSSLNPSTNATSVTFTATVSSAAGTPTGDVVFSTNGVAMATVALSGGIASAATAELPVGTNAVTAEYAAQGNWLGSTNSLSQVVYSAVTFSSTNALLSIVDNKNGTYTLNMQGTPGAEYYVISSGDISQDATNWSGVANTTNTAPSPSGQWSVTVSNAAPVFYRSKAVNPAP